MRFIKTVLILLAVWTVNCQRPPAPPEVKLAESQAVELQRAGGSLFFSREYEAYVELLKSARAGLRQEDLKLGWFRDYEDIRKDFQSAIAAGEELLAKIGRLKHDRRSAIASEARQLQARLDELDSLTVVTIERGPARGELTKAAIILKEAGNLLGGDRFEEAEKRVSEASVFIEGAERAIASHLSRYMDGKNIGIWKRWAEETIENSRKARSQAIIISKLERRLTVYKSGLPVRIFDIGLGINGYRLKRYSGDNATPEGKYKITKKIRNSQYHKALLINYPNQQDKQRFELARKRGEIPASSNIGGSIEIHGGGEDSLTRGCISLDDEKIDELFEMIKVGCPVTIVGTLDPDSSLIRILRKG